MLLSNGALAALKRLNARALTDTGYVRRRTYASDGAGGQTWVEQIAGPYPCYLAVSRLQRGEILQAAEIAGGLPWTITFAAGTDVQLTDEINVSGSLSGPTVSGGREFAVVALYGPASININLSCLCMEKSA
jgi:hypothetical protein